MEQTCSGGGLSIVCSLSCFCFLALPSHQHYQHHQGTWWKCRFPGPIPDLLDHKLNPNDLYSSHSFTNTGTHKLGKPLEELSAPYMVLCIRSVWGNLPEMKILGLTLEILVQKIRERARCKCPGRLWSRCTEGPFYQHCRRYLLRLLLQSQPLFWVTSRC